MVNKSFRTLFVLTYKINFVTRKIGKEIKEIKEAIAFVIVVENQSILVIKMANLIATVFKNRSCVPTKPRVCWIIVFVVSPK